MTDPLVFLQQFNPTTGEYNALTTKRTKNGVVTITPTATLQKMAAASDSKDLRYAELEVANNELRAESQAMKEKLRWKTVAEKPPAPNVVYEVVHMIHGNRGKTLGVWLPTVQPVEGEAPATQHPPGWDVEGVTHYREGDDTWPPQQGEQL